MTSPFVAATLSFAAGRVAFQGATGLKMPFSGAVVIPRPPGETPQPDQMTAQQSLFVPLRFPKSGTGGARLFPTLRTMDGARLSLTGPVLIFVAEDPGLFDEFDLGSIFSQGTVLTPQFPTTGTLTSARPKYLVLSFSGGAQPADAIARAAKDGQDLSGVVSGLPASFSGTLMAFDFAGLEIEADAALAVLGETNVTGAPGGNDVRVQFVDILGKPLAKTALFGLTLDPAVQGADNPRNVYTLAFPGAGRTLKLRVTDPIPASVSDAERYLWRNIKVAVWPGRQARLTPVTPNNPDLDIASGATGTTPSFLRLCIFHPSQTMQTEFGGQLDENARFSRDKGNVAANGFELSAESDEVEVFNDGESYMRDVFEAIEATASGDEIYINNWSTHAHLHMRGTLQRMGLGRSDQSVADADGVLQQVDQNRIIVEVFVDQSGAAAEKKFLALPDKLERGTALDTGLQYELRPVPAPGVADKATAAGFLKPGGTLAFPIKGQNGAPMPSRMIARWKDPTGDVQSAERTLATTIAPLVRPTLDPQTLAVGITTDDPPGGTVIRRPDLGALRASLGGVAGALWLMVVNSTTGRHVVHDLTADPNATDAVLGELPDDTGATDTLHAVVLNAEPGPTDTLADLLVSGAAELKYSTSQHILGDIPLAADSLGGLLRRAIAKQVSVRAIYWDQFLANLGADEETASGHDNNEELTAIINTMRNGRRGMAVRDRATRAFGSFHQKGVVILSGPPAARQVTAWLGGIDLALGRWDSVLHLNEDPDRQKSRWWDAQLRLSGPAASDVLRNFSQRWRAIGAFIGDPLLFAKCIPVNPDTDITQDTTTNVIRPPLITSLARGPEPAANVQITRTCPPRSCHAEITKAPLFGGADDPLGEIDRAGELGSLAAYLKAIGFARRYILINDQYFFSPEIALALHRALSSADGPSALVLMLPQDLGEDPRIDPMLFKVRQKALHILFHGGTFTAPPGPAVTDILRPRGGHITANPAGATSVVAAKTAVLFARNRAAKSIYVHSKVMIVDDVWMSVGSANLNYRSSTYDFEINAGVVGDRIEFGGTDIVRKQRIELARRMLGLPAAYAPLIADPETMFSHFKALEAKDAAPSHNLHPLAPMSQKLDPAYVKKVGDAAFDANVDVVSALDMNDPIIDGLAGAIIDPDGRADKEALAPFAGIVGNSTRAYGRITLTIGCQAMASAEIGAGNDIFAEIRVTEGQTPQRRVHLIALQMSGTTVVPSSAVGEILVPLSTSAVTTIEARLIDSSDTPQNCSASHTVDPAQTPVLAGSIRDIALNTT